jgi:sugar lactone lactonase YvrE
MSPAAQVGRRAGPRVERWSIGGPHRARSYARRVIEYVACRATDVRAEHAEGPAWDGAAGALLWVDIYGHAVLRATQVPDDPLRLGAVERFDVGQCVGAVVPCAAADGHLIADELGVARLAPDGTVTPLRELEAGGRGRMRTNDAKCDPHGRFWVGSMAHAKTPGAASLFRVERDLRDVRVLDGLTISNGLAWTRDGATMFFIDTPRQRVERLALDRAGDVIAHDVAFTIEPSEGAPDGMAIDDEGCLWVALFGGGQVQRYAPSGELLARVDVEVPKVSSCAFGGADGRTLFITTSQEGLTPAEREQQVHAGKVFAVRVDVAGPPADPFTGALSA